MKKLLCAALLVCLSGWIMATNVDSQDDSTRSFPIVNYIYKADRNTTPSVDHSKFDILNQPFDSAQQLTAACLSCHTERGHEIMATSHWNWEREEEMSGKGVVPLGKKIILNNFCIGIKGSEQTCTRCHIGYGWKDDSFDFSEQNNIDCVVCHDQNRDL